MPRYELGAQEELPHIPHPQESSSSFIPELDLQGSFSIMTFSLMAGRFGLNENAPVRVPGAQEELPHIPHPQESSSSFIPELDLQGSFSIMTFSLMAGRFGLNENAPVRVPGAQEGFPHNPQTRKSSGFSFLSKIFRVHFQS